MPPFITINNPFSGSLKKPRGGVSCLIRLTCMEFVKDIDKSQSDLITLTLIGDHRIFGNYIPPADSIYFKDEMFTLIVNQFLPLKQNLVALGAGDINCRIVNAVRKPSPDSNYRDNPDKEINSHGKFLVEISKSFKCFPINNLTYEDKVNTPSIKVIKNHKMTLSLAITPL